MASAIEQITVFVTAEENAMFIKMADEAKLTPEEFLLFAATSCCPVKEAATRAGVVEMLFKSCAKAHAAIDDALAFVDASNQRIAQLELRRLGEQCNSPP